MWQFECGEYLKSRNIAPYSCLGEIKKSTINKKREASGRYLSAGQGTGDDVRTFLQIPSNSNMETKENKFNKQLWEAAARGDVEAVKAALAAGADGTGCRPDRENQPDERGGRRKA